MKSVKIAIPKHDNGHVYFDSAVLDQIEDNLISIAGGLSKYDIAGIWKDNAGNSYYDNNILYEIVCMNDSQVDELRKYVSDVKAVLSQESMFFSVSDLSVEFI